MWSAMKDFSPDTTRMLIGLGASLNAQDDTGMTALHYAVINSNMSACQALVEKVRNSVHPKLGHRITKPVWCLTPQP